MPRDQDFSVPQGSCASPIFCLAYASTLENEIPPEILLHEYGDNHGLKDKFKPSDRESDKSVTGRLVDTTNDIKTWMDSNHLQMNSSKTECIIFVSTRQITNCTTNDIMVTEAKIDHSPVIKYLGVWLDKCLNLRKQITSKCGKEMYNIQCIKKI